jgi:hypothetical protein
MHDYAGEVVLFTKDAARPDLDSNLMLRRALSMSIGIIGEAASHISQTFRDAHAKVPWRDIIGMRNFLFHAYSRLITIFSGRLRPTASRLSFHCWKPSSPATSSSFSLESKYGWEHLRDASSRLCLPPVLTANLSL